MNSMPEHAELFKTLMNTVRSASRLYDLDIAFLRAADRTVGADAEAQSKRLLSVINRLVAAADNGRNPKFRDVGDLVQRWSTVTQTLDTLVDKMDVTMATQKESEPAPKRKVSPEPRKTTPRPQDSFDTPVDNSEGPFKPILTHKHHAIIDLSESVKPQDPDDEHPDIWYDQPYAVEIATSHMPARFYNQIPKKNPKEPKPLDKSKYTWVDTPKKLAKMVATLNKSQEIAVDLEHHDTHSYLGLVSLMQISNHDEDWLVDTLALRTELQVLNSVFTNPYIIKVFHGARMDIQWLQRDLGLYVVNLFDTYEAATALSHPRRGLANLLEKYTGFIANKAFQRADWRRRPLTRDMIHYARGDTHFLLYIYDRLRQELEEQNLLDQVVENSKLVAGIRYEKPGHNILQPAWSSTAYKFSVVNPEHKTIMAKLWDWRDKLARKLDEGTASIMTNRTLASLSLLGPEEVNGVLSIAPSLEPYADEVVALIKNAKEDAASGKVAVAGKRTAAQASASKVPRLDKPHLYGNAVPSFGHETQINLGVFRTRELPISANDESRSIESSEKAPQVEQTHTVETGPSEQDSHYVRRKGKRINVVDSIEEAEKTASKLPKKPTQQKAPDGEAFDFAKAAPVIAKQTEATSRNYSQFKRGDGRGRGGRGGRGGEPRGASAPRRGRAKSFR